MFRNLTDWRFTRTFASAMLAAAVVMIVAPQGRADEASIRSDVWSIARGGQLYDSWWAVLGSEPPKETHPAYPAAGKQSGKNTWRCKECHGWDYRGAAGAYAKGSHRTGIAGIRNSVGAEPAAVAAALRGPAHGYTKEMIPDREMENLARFVSLGQIDMDLYVDRVTKRSRGDAQRGARYYQTICAVCHGFDGKMLNFKDEKSPEYVGTIAKENPWEFLHKARFGQPGIPMISLITLPAEDLADLLAYSQTLPEK